jgi:ATPase subunit of ABC transporter with duplicated ATPase domains
MIRLDDLGKQHGTRLLFAKVSLDFEPGKRFVLTGANGAGKSTLLRIISGQETPTTGRVTLAAGCRVGFLEQEQAVVDEVSVIEAVVRGNPTLWAALEEKQRLLLREEMDLETGLRLGELESILAAEGGYTAEARASTLLVGLGLPRRLHPCPVGSLSGGQKARVFLARALFLVPDVLLLDEPTNHLDLDDIGWLESYLVNKFRGTLLVVSHDRHFMNAIATHVADVDFHDVRIHKGNHEAFVEQKAASQRHQQEMLSEQRRFIASITSRLRLSSDSGGRRGSVSRADRKRLARLEASLPFTRSSVRKPHIKLPIGDLSHQDVLRVEGAEKSFGGGWHLGPLHLHVRRGDRLFVLGNTGVGKTTLLKLLLGELPLDAGHLDWGPRVSVGYLPQGHEKILESGLTIQEWLHRCRPEAEVHEVRSILGRLLFFSGKAGEKRTEDLSGGEVTRLFLARLILQKSNVLVLDEPTNHLDLESVEALILALSGYEGTVIATSHNRDFVARVSAQILDLSAAEPALFHGTYDEWIEG